MRHRAADRLSGLRLLGIGLIALAGACAHEPIEGEPHQVWAAQGGLDDAKACIVSALDDYRHTQTALAPAIPHRVVTVAPGRIYQVRPSQEGAVSNEDYYVRLEKIDDHITRVSLFAHSPWRKQLVEAVRRCAGR